MKRLRPITRVRRISRVELNRTARHFERRAKAATEAAELAKVAQFKRKENERSWTDANSVRESLQLSHAIYESGRFTWEEYFFHSALPVEHLHEHRLFTGAYEELRPISAKIREIEAKYGLRDGQYWPRGAGPEEYQKLNTKYDKIVDLKLGSLFRELGLSMHARLWLRDRAEFDRLREAGRASAFESEDIEHATASTCMSARRKSARKRKLTTQHVSCLARHLRPSFS